MIRAKENRDQRRRANMAGKPPPRSAPKGSTQLPLRVFTLYIGTTQPGAKEAILRILSDTFPSFTLIEGQGYFRGLEEPMWFVRLATETPALVLQTAELIRRTLHQEGVGIEYASRFYRCTPDDRATELQTRLQAEEA